MSRSVVVVDDHAIISHSLADALRRSGYAVEVLDPLRLDDDAVLAGVAAHDRPVVLLDLHLGDRSSLDLVRPLTRGGATVVLLTASDDEAVIGGAVEAGAVGVIHKSEPFHELVDAIAKVVAGQPILGPVRRQSLLAAAASARTVQARSTSVLGSLTDAERAVLTGLVAGQGVRDIAAERFVGVETVRSQVKAILRKLGARTQVQAVAIAKQAGFGRDHPSGG